MLTRTLTAICIAAALGIPMTTANAGALHNVVVAGKQDIALQREVFESNLSLRTKLKDSVAIDKLTVRCARNTANCI